MSFCQNQYAPVLYRRSARINRTAGTDNTHSNPNIPNRPQTFGLYWVHLGLDLLQRDQLRLGHPVSKSAQSNPIKMRVKAQRRTPQQLLLQQTHISYSREHPIAQPARVAMTRTMIFWCKVSPPDVRRWVEFEGLW